MIVAERKPIKEIAEMIKDYNNVLIVGCGTCVTVCFAGGEKEVGILSSALRMFREKTGNKLEIIEKTIERQCEKEMVDELKDHMVFRICEICGKHYAICECEKPVWTTTQGKHLLPEEFRA